MCVKMVRKNTISIRHSQPETFTEMQGSASTAAGYQHLSS